MIFVNHLKLNQQQIPSSQQQQQQKTYNCESVSYNFFLLTFFLKFFIHFIQFIFSSSFRWLIMTMMMMMMIQSFSFLATKVIMTNNNFISIKKKSCFVISLIIIRAMCVYVCSFSVCYISEIFVCLRIQFHFFLHKII